MLSYFPAYQFPKVFKKMKQNNDFQLDIISIHNTSYACLHQNMHFFPKPGFQGGDCWILIRKYSEQWNQNTHVIRTRK